MPRRLRVASGGYVYHVLNRAVGRLRIFGKRRDFETFEEVIGQAKERLPMRVLAWCVMPNHWHFVLWPRGDGDLSEFMRWRTVTHTQRWHAAHRTAGTGPLYQGRFQSFPIQEDDHLWTALRYVERNPLRANLVETVHGPGTGSFFGPFRAEEGACPLPTWHRAHGAAAGLLDDGPLPLPRRWPEHVQTPQTEGELESLRRSVVRGAPLGEASWQGRTAKKLGLQSSLRSRGRPRKRAPKPE
jgi:putative transposase